MRRLSLLVDHWSIFPDKGPELPLVASERSPFTPRQAAAFGQARLSQIC
jgi:hypothetical protein